MDSPPKFSETMDFIVQFLRAEGFYAAEEALLREMDNRCPDGSSPTASATNNQRFEAEGNERQSFDSLAQSNSPHSGPQRTGSPREDVGWQDQGELAEADSEALDQAATYVPLQEGARLHHSGSQELPVDSQQELDEYSDENDPGYVREYIRGQDAFIAREIDLSDEDASQRGLRLYHEAQGMKNLHWDRGGRDDADEDGSSDGNGSSYFSGEVVERVGSFPGSHVSASERDKSGLDDDRVITLMEPVNPVPSHLPPASLAPLAQEALRSPRETGADISSEHSVEGGGGLYHEPSLGMNALVPDIKTTDTATSSSRMGEEGQQEAGRPEGPWGRGYLDPFGVLNRVFGRRNSSSNTSSPSAAKAEDKRSPLAGSMDDECVEAEDDPQEVEASGASDADTSNGASLADGVARPEGLKDIPASSDRDAPKAPVILEPELQTAMNGVTGSAADSDTESSFHPETPKLAAKPGESDSAFSFPVTPPSEPPAAAEPGAVFGTWPSQKGSSRKLGSKGDLTSRASSEYAASGYSTDEGGSQVLWTQESGGKASEGGQADVVPREPEIDHSTLEEAVTEGKSLGALEKEATADTIFLPPPPSAARDARKAPVAIQPLDMSASLPDKQALDFHFSASHRPGVSTSPSEEAVPAYKPQQSEPAADWSARSGFLTERTMETAMGGEDSTAGGGAASADDYSSVTYRWDEDYLNEKYEMLTLKVIHRRRRTGFEESKDIAIQVNDLIAGRYQVTDFLGSAAFSQAVQALDVKTGGVVCLKIIKNNKDYLDQSLDEIKLLKYVNEHDPNDEHGLLQLYDYFYYKEHLFLVCELLRANLYEFQKYNRDHGHESYFTLPRVQSIARQVLRSLEFMHSLSLIHCDLKPENILIKSYSRCQVKVIDLGSSCFTTDHLSSYVQSRSYRAPEVILGLPYHQQVDIWSLGCILAELLSGYVLFQNDSLATLLARLEGIMGPIPRKMLRNGRYAHRFYTRNGALYEQSTRTGRYELLRPKRTSLKFRVPEADEGCLDFLQSLLTIDPKMRPTATEALRHPWLQQRYENDSV